MKGICNNTIIFKMCVMKIMFSVKFQVYVSLLDKIIFLEYKSKNTFALTSVARLIEHHPMYQMIPSLIPSQSPC